MQTHHGSLVELPVQRGTDDWPVFAHYDEIGYMMPVRGASAGLAPFWEEFEAQYETGGFWVGIWHPFLTVRLARWRQAERRLETVLTRGDVWFATLTEIAAHVRTQDAGRTGPRVFGSTAFHITAARFPALSGKGRADPVHPIPEQFAFDVRCPSDEGAQERLKLGELQ